MQALQGKHSHSKQQGRRYKASGPAAAACAPYLSPLCSHPITAPPTEAPQTTSERRIIPPGALTDGEQERQIRPVFANTEIFGGLYFAVFTVKKAKHMPPNSYLAGGPKFVFDVPDGEGQSTFL